MSQQPPYPPQPPLGYAGVMPTMPPSRPTAITVIAIIAIVFGSLGLLGGICGIFGLVVGNVAGSAQQPNLNADPIIRTYNLVYLPILIALAAIELWAGIGSLSLKPAARIWLLRYAVAGIVLSLVQIGFTILVMAPRMAQVLAQQANTGAGGPQAQQLKAIMQGSAYGGVCCGVILLIWPAVILYYYNQPNIIAAFERRNALQQNIPPFGP